MSEVKYGHVASAEDLTRINQMIRRQIKVTSQYRALRRLVRQSMYLVTLTHSPAWSNIGNITTLRRRAKEEFEITAKTANAKLEQSKRFDTQYGRGEYRGV
jgi:hypothetical protein